MPTTRQYKMELAIARIKRDYSKTCVAFAHHLRTLEQHDAQLKLLETNIANRKVLKDKAYESMNKLKTRLESMEKAKESIDNI